MKITRKQLRRIIREAVETGYKGVPYLEGSYDGNGTVPYGDWEALVPAMEEIGAPMYGPALGIIAGTYTPPGDQVPLPYIPFIYAAKVLDDLEDILNRGAVTSLDQQMIDYARQATSDRDNEYNEPYDDW